MAFTAPVSIKPKKLMKVACGLAGHGYEFGVAVFPLRKGEDAKALLLGGRGDELTLAEWAFFLEDQACWEECSRKELDDLILLVYEQFVENSALRTMFSFKLVLGMQDSELSVVRPLFENLDLVKDRLSRLDELRFSWIELIYDKNYAQVIDYCISHGRSHHRIMIELGWAGLSKLDERLFLTVLEAVKATKCSDDLLLEYFVTLEVDRCGSLLNCLLSSTSNLSDSLNRWIRFNASPAAKTREIWDRLDAVVQLAIINRLDLNAFHLTTPIMKGLADALEKLQTEEMGREARRLRSRYNFWTNYTSSIITGKWLHHPKFEGLMQSQALEGPHIGVLNCNSSDVVDGFTSPFLVLEFRDYLIVDQLLHSFGVVKIFKKNAVLLDKLFGGTLCTSPCSVSLKALLLEVQLDVHDHMQFWQGSLESKLREQYEILPDKNTTRFKGLPSSIEYDPKYGLPAPSLAEIEARNEQLKEWEAAFFANERRLGKYSSSQVLDVLETQIRKPRINRLLQEDKTRVAAVTELKVGVKNEEYWATKLLGEYLLTSPNLSKQDRFDGERYLAKARQWGQVTSASGKAVRVAQRKRK
ncbi:hypothetical protein A3742_15130 [Oleiphilus sp. HI0071]|uniref:hypothetical protein n=2 Tax=Oleiphilus sp. HI0080 TaxID=1822255 RepID=UPI0007C34E97|nr:hypothetical protein [Oleiphilus sp. HI0080]KZY60156.1 hypothetical protein A3737_06995 [Oleiphilus sp. HI0065]KZY78477.1 hypothetical protein A3742_15130 [Oleiphilus sp. HI0071]KZY90125.1 hypothetical protein A3744_05760 [Oleiphilus sp. HI0073]KZZ49642.1 hypothetical protein A3760_14700 [Oleiphilus sp. HI0122]KZZ17720.1 hypothetical protein A3751_10630 [Oleiphilus sp. HI0080]